MGRCPSRQPMRPRFAQLDRGAWRRCPMTPMQTPPIRRPDMPLPFSLNRPARPRWLVKRGFAAALPPGGLARMTDPALVPQWMACPTHPITKAEISNLRRRGGLSAMNGGCEGGDHRRQRQRSVFSNSPARSSKTELFDEDGPMAKTRRHPPCWNRSRPAPGERHDRICRSEQRPAHGAAKRHGMKGCRAPMTSLKRAAGQLTTLAVRPARGGKGPAHGCQRP